MELSNVGGPVSLGSRFNWRLKMPDSVGRDESGQSLKKRPARMKHVGRVIILIKGEKSPKGKRKNDKI